MSIQDRLQQLADDGYLMVEAIPRITQAFTDEGWHEPIVIHTPGVELEPTHYMSGQEWYERFSKEIDTPIEGNQYEVLHEMQDRKRYLEVVRKVVGME